MGRVNLATALVSDLNIMPTLEGAACRRYPGEAFLWDGKSEDDRRTLNQLETDIRRAKGICNGECPVRLDCLAWAIKEDIVTGIWGGKDLNERRAIVRKVRAERQASCTISLSA